MSRRPRRPLAPPSPPPAPGGDVELGAFLAWLGAGEVPPAVDRWLGEWLRTVGLTRDPKVQAIVDFLDAAVAWGTLAAFNPFRTRGRAVDAALLKFAAVVRRPKDLLELWRRADAGFAERVRGYAAGADPAGDLAALSRLADETTDPEVAVVARLVVAGLPPWHAPAVKRREEVSGSDWVTRWRAAQGSRPPLWLRVAEPRHTASVRDMLGAEGLRVTEQDGAGLAVVGPTPVFRTRAWREGRVEIQDLASQRVGEAVPLAAGQLAWDACAGTGGKTLHLWARLGGRGAIHASDAAPGRLAELRKRLARVDGRNVRSWAWDGRGPCLLPDEAALRGGFDVVLVDAPCSGSGTWRRRPDARLRSVATAIPRWAAQQVELLGHAAESVRPGGALVYATCSVWVEEDEEVVARFTAENPGWVVEHQALVGAPDLNADTLFVAVLRC